MMDFTQVNQKFLDGDGITDEELGYLCEWYSDLDAKLGLLGKEFYLPWKESHFRLAELQQFAQARLQEKERYPKVSRPV